MHSERPGCLSGLFRLAVLTIAFEWLEGRFGFGRGCSCTGCGCGVLLLILFLLFACSIILATDWTRLNVLEGMRLVIP